MNGSDFERAHEARLRRQRGGARRGDALAAHAGALPRARGAERRASAAGGGRWCRRERWPRRRSSLARRRGSRPAGERRRAGAPLGDLEILLGEEDLEMLDEELEFYGWLEEQPEFAMRATAWVDAQDQCRVAARSAVGGLRGAHAQEAEQERRSLRPSSTFSSTSAAWAEEDDEWLAIEEWREGEPRRRIRSRRRRVREGRRG